RRRRRSSVGARRQRHLRIVGLRRRDLVAALRRVLRRASGWFLLGLHLGGRWRLLGEGRRHQVDALRRRLLLHRLLFRALFLGAGLEPLLEAGRQLLHALADELAHAVGGGGALVERAALDLRLDARAVGAEGEVLLGAHPD